MKTTPPTARNLPKNERRLEPSFGGLGFGVDVVNDAERLFIGFIVGASHRSRIMADEIKLRVSYLFKTLDYLNVLGTGRSLRFVSTIVHLS